MDEGVRQEMAAEQARDNAMPDPADGRKGELRGGQRIEDGQVVEGKTAIDSASELEAVAEALERLRQLATRVANWPDGYRTAEEMHDVADQIKALAASSQPMSGGPERDEAAAMTYERFKAWANEIGLTGAQWMPVWYVIGREFERGKTAAALAALAPDTGQEERRCASGTLGSSSGTA